MIKQMNEYSNIYDDDDDMTCLFRIMKLVTSLQIDVSLQKE